VNPEDRIEIRNVEVGDTVGAKWIVNTGLKAGERVVVEGIQKVRDGMPVTIRPASDAKAQTKDTAPRSTS